MTLKMVITDAKLRKWSESMASVGLRNEDDGKAKRLGQRHNQGMPRLADVMSGVAGSQ